MVMEPARVRFDLLPNGPITNKASLHVLPNGTMRYANDKKY